MAEAALSIKLRCASWQQLATIYKRDISRGTMFLKAAAPPMLGTKVRIDLTLPSASVIALSGVVTQHVNDPQRGSGVDLKLDPLPSSSVWLIESALAAEQKVRAGTSPGIPRAGTDAGSGPVAVVGSSTPPQGVAAIPPLPPIDPTAPPFGGADRRAQVPAIGGAPARGTPPPRPPPTPKAASSPGSAPNPLPGINDGAEMATAEHDLIGALMSEAESLRKLNPFLVLGVGYEATDADVRSAFGELTKRYHPDRFARYEAADLRKVAAEIFILIRDAYRKLSDDASRTLALQQLGRSSQPRAARLGGGPPPPPSKQTGPVRVPAKFASTESLRTEPGVTPEMRPPATTPATGTPAVAPNQTRPGFQRPPAPPAQAQPRAVTAPAVQVPTKPESRSQSGLDNLNNKPALAPTERASDTNERLPRADHPNRAERHTPDVTAPLPAQAETGRPVLHAPSASAASTAAESGDSSLLDEMLDAGKLDEAVAAYKLLAKKHPQERSYRAGIELCEGLRFLDKRDRLEAAQHFESALEIDPSNERAARELAEMRRQATNERKGLLSRLMGKKDA